MNFRGIAGLENVGDFRRMKRATGRTWKREHCGRGVAIGELVSVNRGQACEHAVDFVRAARPLVTDGGGEGVVR